MGAIEEKMNLEPLDKIMESVPRGAWAELIPLLQKIQKTYGYLPQVYYYAGQVRQAMKSEGFAKFYETYLSIREKAAEDPLLADVRKRAGK